MCLANFQLEEKREFLGAGAEKAQGGYGSENAGTRVLV